MLRMSEKALVGAGKLKMKEHQVLEFLTGPESEGNAVCQDARGHYYCHRQVECVTIWMEYHREEDTLWVDNVYHHRIVVHE